MADGTPPTRFGGGQKDNTPREASLKGYTSIWQAFEKGFGRYSALWGIQTRQQYTQQSCESLLRRRWGVSPVTALSRFIMRGFKTPAKTSPTRPKGVSPQSFAQIVVRRLAGIRPRSDCRKKEEVKSNLHADKYMRLKPLFAPSALQLHADKSFAPSRAKPDKA